MFQLWIHAKGEVIFKLAKNPRRFIHSRQDVLIATAPN